MLTAMLAMAISRADQTRARESVTSNENYEKTTGDTRERINIKTTLTLQTGGGRISGQVELVTTTEATSVSTGARVGSLIGTARGQLDVNACPDEDGIAEGDAGLLGLLDHLVRGLGHVGQLLLGEGHRAVIERDQVSRHLMAPSPGGIFRLPLTAAWMSGTRRALSRRSRTSPVRPVDRSGASRRTASSATRVHKGVEILVSHHRPVEPARDQLDRSCAPA